MFGKIILDVSFDRCVGSFTWLGMAWAYPK